MVSWGAAGITDQTGLATAPPSQRAAALRNLAGAVVGRRQHASRIARDDDVEHGRAHRVGEALPQGAPRLPAAKRQPHPRRLLHRRGRGAWVRPLSSRRSRHRRRRTRARRGRHAKARRLARGRAASGRDSKSAAQVLAMRPITLTRITSLTTGGSTSSWRVSVRCQQPAAYPRVRGAAHRPRRVPSGCAWLRIAILSRLPRRRRRAGNRAPSCRPCRRKGAPFR